MGPYEIAYPEAVLSIGMKNLVRHGWSAIRHFDKVFG